MTWNKFSHPKLVVYIVYLTVALLVMLLVPAAASAAVTQTVNLEGWNAWKPLVQTAAAASDRINVGETTQVTFEIVSIHEMNVSGNVAVDFTGETDLVNVRSLEVRLEIENGTNNWVPYKDRDGNDIIIPVVTAPTPVVGTAMSFPVYTFASFSSYDTVGKNLRWASYMELERNSGADSRVYNGFKIISRWRGP